MFEDIVSRDLLNRALPTLEKQADKISGLFEIWIGKSNEKVFGSGLGSGNHRSYETAFDDFIREAEFFNGMWFAELDALGPVVFDKVSVADILLKTAPHEQNMWNAKGDARDQDRMYQHRIKYEQAHRVLRQIFAALEGLRSEISAINGAVVAK